MSFSELAARLRATGRSVLALECCESTNAEALSLAARGAAHGTVVIANQQRAGRGRGGHEWFSPAGAVLMSVIHRPNLPPHQMAQATLQAAVSVARAVEAVVGRPPGLKWPNDLRYSGRKVAGILLELELRAGDVAGVVVGVGINVAPLPPELPAELAGTATDLSAVAGRAVDRAAVAVAVVTALDQGCAHLERTGRYERDAWLSYQDCLGRVVWVDSPARVPYRAEAVDVDVHGRLVVVAHGRRETVIAGDVRMEES